MAKRSDRVGKAVAGFRQTDCEEFWNSYGALVPISWHSKLNSSKFPLQVYYIYLLCVNPCVLCMHAHKYDGQEKTSDPSYLKLQVFVSHPV